MAHSEIALIFGKFEGYILSGIGSRSVPVDRLAGWLSDENVISFNFLKFSSGQMLQHLACLNEDIALLELYTYSIKVDFSYSEFYTIVYLSAFLSEAMYFWVDPYY